MNDKLYITKKINLFFFHFFFFPVCAYTTTNGDGGFTNYIPYLSLNALTYGYDWINLNLTIIYLYYHLKK